MHVNYSKNEIHSHSCCWYFFQWNSKGEFEMNLHEALFHTATIYNEHEAPKGPYKYYILYLFVSFMWTDQIQVIQFFFFPLVHSNCCGTFGYDKHNPSFASMFRLKTGMAMCHTMVCCHCFQNVIDSCLCCGWMWLAKWDLRDAEIYLGNNFFE